MKSTRLIKVILFVGVALSSVTQAFSQTDEEFFFVSRKTNRVITSNDLTSTQTTGHVVRDENLISGCWGYGSYSDLNFDWTTPFASLYESDWHFTYDQTFTLTSGQWIEVVDHYKFSEFGSGGPITMAKEAEEEITWWYVVIDEYGIAHDMGNVVGGRSERKWYERTTSCTIKSPESGGGSSGEDVG